MDDTMELLAQRERVREEQNKYKPPPLTPPNFWDPDIVELEPDDPRNTCILLFTILTRISQSQVPLRRASFITVINLG